MKEELLFAGTRVITLSDWLEKLSIPMFYFFLGWLLGLVFVHAVALYLGLFGGFIAFFLHKMFNPVEGGVIMFIILPLIAIGGGGFHVGAVRRGCNEMDQGKYQAAIVQFTREIDWGSDTGFIREKRAFCYEHLGDHKSALEEFHRAIKEYEGDQSSEIWLLATCPEPELRDGKRARDLSVALLQKGPEDSEGLDTVAAAFAENGQFDKAVTFEKMSLAGVKQEDREEEEQRLALYLAKMPYHEKIELTAP